MQKRMGSSERRSEELESLAAIYGEEFTVKERELSFSIDVNAGLEKDDCLLFRIHVDLTERYPDLEAPSVHIENLSGEYIDFANLLNESTQNFNFEPILFTWIENIRSQLLLKGEGIVSKKQSSQINTLENKKVISDETIEKQVALVDIIHGSPSTFQKSTFQAHLALVKSVQEVNVFMEQLLKIKKIQNATHNILAYRIISGTDSMIQDFDDDGERAAGGRLLHLLQVVNVRNIAVCVSRWYGGIKLGPARFSHINNAARCLLDRHGCLNPRVKNKKPQTN